MASMLPPQPQQHMGMGHMGVGLYSGVPPYGVLHGMHPQVQLLRLWAVCSCDFWRMLCSRLDTFFSAGMFVSSLHPTGQPALSCMRHKPRGIGHRHLPSGIRREA